MTIPRRLPKWSVVLLLLGLLACASTRGDTAPGDTAAGDAVTVIVINEQVGATLANVFIEPVGGIRVNLGRVQPNATGTFQHDLPTGQYTLSIVGADTGTTRTSERFTVRPGRTITWDLASGRVTFRDR